MRLYSRLRRISKIVLEKLVVPNREGIEHYDKVLPPEVANDDFFDALKQLASNPELCNILEIGSSSGEGSTRALIEGVLTRNQHDHVAVYCLEISEVRFKNLKKAYSDFDFVKIFRLSSVGLDSFPSVGELKDFYRNVPSILNNYTFDEVVSWLKKDIEYLTLNQRDLAEQSEIGSLGGIEYVKKVSKVSVFDLVVIDGGEFLGWAEYNQVKGSRFMCLDDINSFKCRRAYDHLSSDPAYELRAENWNVRNGWAIFERQENHK
jgi:hypothetical protein